MSPHAVPVILNSSDTKQWDGQDSQDRGLILQDFEESGFWSRNSFVQIIYGLWANQVVLCSGLAFGFSAVTFPQIKATTTQDVWISTVIVLISSLGGIFCGYSIDRIGRREMMVLSMLPLAVGWMLTGFAVDWQGMIYGRIVTGIGVGMAATPPRAYCVEIALPKMRAVLGALHILAMVTGIFLQAILYLYCSLKITCFICSAHATVIMLMNIFLPETPYFALLSNKNIMDIRKALNVFRAESYDSEPELQEIAKFGKRNRIRKLTLVETIKHSCRCEWCKPFSILIIYCMIAQLSGCSVFKYWPVDKLMVVAPSFKDTVLFGLLRIFSAGLVMISIFNAHRRQMAIASFVAVAMMFALLSLYMMTETKITFITKFIFMLVVVAGTFGPYTLPMLMIFEVIPLELRGFLGSIATIIQQLTVFGALQLFPYVRNWLSFPHLLLLYALMSFTGAVFVYFLLPETHGLSLIDIQTNLMIKQGSAEFLRQRNMIDDNTSLEDITIPKSQSKNRNSVRISNVVDVESQTDKTNQTDTGVSAPSSKSLITE